MSVDGEEKPVLTDCSCFLQEAWPEGENEGGILEAKMESNCFREWAGEFSGNCRVTSEC